MRQTLKRRISLGQFQREGFYSNEKMYTGVGTELGNDPRKSIGQGDRNQLGSPRVG